MINFTMTTIRTVDSAGSDIGFENIFRPFYSEICNVEYVDENNNPVNLSGEENFQYYISKIKEGFSGDMNIGLSYGVREDNDYAVIWRDLGDEEVSGFVTECLTSETLTDEPDKLQKVVMICQTPMFEESVDNSYSL